MGKITSLIQTFFPLKIRKEIKYLVEIHDVHPFFLDNVRKILEILPKDLKLVIGITPFYNRMNMKEKFADIIKLLDKYNKVEFALHGYYHEMFEFKRIDLIEAKNRIESGLRFLKDLSIEDVYVFIPPNWALSKENLELLKEYFDYTSTISWIYSFKSKKIIYSPLWIYGFGDIFRIFDFIITKINRLISYISIFLLEYGILRIIIHPENIFNKDLEKLVELLNNLKNFKNITYSDIQ